MDLDNLLNPGTPAGPETVEQPEVQDPPQGEVETEGSGAPTAPQGEGAHVPLAALEAERKGRQDWKEKAIRAEAERDALLRERGQSQQPQGQPTQMDPLQAVQQQIINERFNISEMMLRQQHKDVDEKVNVFMEAARANPALMAALQTQQHPWEFAYKEGARQLMLKEVGDDPAAYRAKIEAEVRASLQPAAAAPAAPQVPTSLNGTRSVAPRSASSYTGPMSLGDMFPNR